MTLKKLSGLLSMIVLLGAPALAVAQERGRTDGPENSEWGKGGYSRPGSNRFSLGLDFGAAIPSNSFGAVRTPLYVGLTASYWAMDYFTLDFSPSYSFANDQTNLLLGPRFRTAGYPVSAFVGVKAGPMLVPGAVYFGISPSVGADLVLAEHILAGLAYNLDIPFGALGYVHRVGMTVGYRF